MGANGVLLSMFPCFVSMSETLSEFFLMLMAAKGRTLLAFLIAGSVIQQRQPILSLPSEMLHMIPQIMGFSPDHALGVGLSILERGLRRELKMGWVVGFALPFFG
jgi:hypothetical protein